MALNNELSVNLGLPENPITQNAEMFTELKKVYNALRAVTRALDSYTGLIGEQPEFYSQASANRCTAGLNSKLYLECGENIDYANIVGIKSDGKVYKSIGTTPMCIGFCTTVGGGITGGFIEVQLFGIMPLFAASTLTPGNLYYQSATAGLVGASGTRVIGFAITDQILYFTPQL